MSQAYLAKEVLEEVPGQVTGYMKKIGVKPKPPVLGSRQSSFSGHPATAGVPPPSQPPAAPYAGAYDAPPSYAPQGQPPPMYPGSGGGGVPGDGQLYFRQ